MQLYQWKNNSCKKALSFWCPLDTDIVFLIILNTYRFFSFQIVANCVFVVYVLLSILYYNKPIPKIFEIKLFNYVINVINK